MISGGTSGQRHVHTPKNPSPLSKEIKPEPAKRRPTQDEDDKSLALVQLDIRRRQAAEANRNFPAHFPQPGSRRTGHADAASERAAAALAGAQTDEFLRSLDHRLAVDHLNEATRRVEKADKRNRNVLFSNLPGYRSEKKFQRALEEYRSAQNREANAAHELRKAQDALSRLQQGA